MYKYTLVFIIALLFSCSGCDRGAKEVTHENFVPTADGAAIGKNVDILAVVSRKLGKLGQACAYMPAEVIASVIGKTAAEINVINSTPAGSDPERTGCFYKWDDPEDLFNAGIFVQLQKNPYADQEEYATFVEQMIESKRTIGEQTSEGETTLFKKFEGFGDDGSYSTEGGKYFWRLGDQIVFQIAFNTIHGPDEQYRMARILAKSLTESYLK